MSQLAKRVVPLIRTSAQKMNFTSEGTCPCPPSGACKRVRSLQEKFTAENECPVHLKGGTGDKFLYRMTMGLAILGAGISFLKLVQMAIS